MLQYLLQGWKKEQGKQKLSIIAGIFKARIKNIRKRTREKNEEMCLMANTLKRYSPLSSQ